MGRQQDRRHHVGKQTHACHPHVCMYPHTHQADADAGEDAADLWSPRNDRLVPPPGKWPPLPLSITGCTCSMAKPLAKAIRRKPPMPGTQASAMVLAARKRRKRAVNNETDAHTLQNTLGGHMHTSVPPNTSEPARQSRPRARRSRPASNAE